MICYLCAHNHPEHSLELPEVKMLLEWKTLCDVHRQKLNLKYEELKRAVPKKYILKADPPQFIPNKIDVKPSFIEPREPGSDDE